MTLLKSQLAWKEMKAWNRYFSSHNNKQDQSECLTVHKGTDVQDLRIMMSNLAYKVAILNFGVHCMWIPCHHGMPRPQGANGENGPSI
jgi:hypothetical protein